jgi:2,3-bisphosphoglycerate-independent phosphoglycerate mutase
VVKTSHSLNPVPFLVHHADRGDRYEVVDVPGAGIASATATCLELLGFVPPDDLAPSLVRFR